MVVVEPERPGLDGVGDVAVEHPHAADAGLVRDAHRALGVVARGGHLSGAPGAVPVAVDEVVPGRGVVVVLVHVVARQRVVVGRQVGVGALNTVILRKLQQHYESKKSFKVCVYSTRIVMETPLPVAPSAQASCTFMSNILPRFMYHCWGHLQKFKTFKSKANGKSIELRC